MRIAVEGCAHGELATIYATLDAIERENEFKIDLLVICGDVQTLRNAADLKQLACPPKYRQLGDFSDYFAGRKEAPVLTIMIGGNHESIGYLRGLYHGGWVCPNIYFLGYTGVLRVGDLRIAGMSGIYKSQHYDTGYFEKPPFDESSIRSAYHVRHYDLQKIQLINGPVDIFLSHDWPSGIEHCGNLKQLLAQKPFFREDIEAKRLGNPHTLQILHQLKPSYWFSAHLHVKFPAVVEHPETNEQTKFLALDKCLPRRDFLQIVEVQTAQDVNVELKYDPEWLAILRVMEKYRSESRQELAVPGRVELRQEVEQERLWITQHITDLNVPLNFTRTVPVQPATGRLDEEEYRETLQSHFRTNPQTLRFCEMLQIPTPFSLAQAELESNVRVRNPQEIIMDDLSESD